MSIQKIRVMFRFVLITIPLQTDASMPYGLVYAKEPTAATAKFIHAVLKIKKKD